jgi:DNA polymerase, archaea type
MQEILYGKKNRFVGYTGKENEGPIIKGLDGLADSNPLWIRRWFFNIVNEITKKPEERFETIPKMLREAVFDLEMLFVNHPVVSRRN